VGDFNGRLTIPIKRLAEYADEIKSKSMIKGRNSHCYRWWKYFRGVAGASAGMDRVQGLYGNVSNRYQRNGITRFIRKGMKTRLQTALKMESIAEPYIKKSRSSS
jgi:uridylate kinase